MSLSFVKQHLSSAFFRSSRPAGHSICRIPFDIRVLRKDKIHEWLAEVIDELKVIVESSRQSRYEW